MTPEQCREARLLIGWSKADLARAAVLSFSTIHRFEERGIISSGALQSDIQRALEAAGVEFMPENSDGILVRLRTARPQLRPTDHVDH